MVTSSRQEPAGDGGSRPRPTSTPRPIALVGLSALAAAYTAQYGFGLEPCILCLYQRVPYAVALGLGLLGLVALRPAGLQPLLVLIAGLGFLAGAGIAGYHVGVEQRRAQRVPRVGEREEDSIRMLGEAPLGLRDQVPVVDDHRERPQADDESTLEVGADVDVFEAPVEEVAGVVREQAQAKGFSFPMEKQDGC